MKHTVTVNETGQIPLPAEWLQKHDIRHGDTVDVVENEDGSLTLLPNDVILSHLLHEIGNVLQEKGMTFEQLLEHGEQIRQDRYDEIYGST